ncbi:MAG: AAA family ATPase [Candidatus Poribacteria bacterium]|nr:AAA family ATPase [Candidatus Poribacteria bacterium]
MGGGRNRRDRDPFFPDDDRRGRRRRDELEDDAGPDNWRAQDLLQEILAETPENDHRRATLYQLRRQLMEDEQKMDEAQAQVKELESAVEQLTAPANRIGIFLGSPKEGTAHLALGGSDYYTNVDPRLNIAELNVGTQVLLNEAYVVIGDLGYSETGAITKITEILEDKRVRIGGEPTGAASLLRVCSDLAEVKLNVGDEVRIDPSGRVALETFAKQEAKDYYLDEVPVLPWEKVGGQADAIRGIKDAIEMPVLHPELFERFQFSTPKGFLLYGPPGCGKTLIGKATAYNLIEKLKEETGKDVRGEFLHIKGPEILNMWLGESERKVREIFQIARDKKKAGILPFIFIDEAESVLGTRRAMRAHNISNTIVPMFCSEMDGIESLQDVVIILATNRPDLIDPAILRPGRIDRKIKVNRPDREGSREIFHIYLKPDLPIDGALVERCDGSVEGAVETLVNEAMEELFARRDDTRFLEISLASGSVETLHRGELVSGAIIRSIVDRAKEKAIKRSILEGGESGINSEDVIAAIAQEYRENDIFPPTDNSEDWLKLVDYDPENVVQVSPIRPSKAHLRRRMTEGVI